MTNSAVDKVDRDYVAPMNDTVRIGLGRVSHLRHRVYDQTNTPVTRATLLTLGHYGFSDLFQQALIR